jgi:hypothetical protein
MKKWSEIKQAILNKLFLEENEAQQQGYLAKFQYLANECLVSIANRVKPRVAEYTVVTEDAADVITMPKDFLSFYVDGAPNPKIHYLTSNMITGLVGENKIYYNALWQEITNEDVTKDTPLDIDQSILHCLPTYVAAQLLSQDDVQRSAILKNEYELLIAGLNTDVMYETNHFESEGGWY